MSLFDKVIRGFLKRPEIPTQEVTRVAEEPALGSKLVAAQQQISHYATQARAHATSAQLKLGYTLPQVSRAEEAVAQAKEAIKLEPFDSHWRNVYKGKLGEDPRVPMRLNLSDHAERMDAIMRPSGDLAEANRLVSEADDIARASPGIDTTNLNKTRKMVEEVNYAHTALASRARNVYHDIRGDWIV